MSAAAIEWTLPAEWDAWDYRKKSDWAFAPCSPAQSSWRLQQLAKAEDSGLDTEEWAEETASRQAARLSLSDLMAREFAPLDWVIPGVIPEGTTLIVAPPKAGKSLLVLDIALACATGGTALGKVAVGAPRPVLYLDLESGERRLQRRVQAQDWTDFGLFEYHLERATAWDELEAFMRDHAGERPLVVVDTLAAVMPPKAKDTTSYQHEYDTLARLQRLTRDDPGAGIIIVHHTRKAVTSDPMERISGTNGLAGAIDTPIVLDRPDRKTPEGVLNVMSRDVEDAEFAMKLDGARWTLDGDDPSDAQASSSLRSAMRDRLKLGKQKQSILLALEAFDRPTSAEDLVSAVAGLTRGQADSALGWLVQHGWAERPARGLYVATTGGD